MEEDKTKRYLYSINKMIKSGNAKYMSYISREYMKYMKTSPVISEAIGDMIFKEVRKNEKSPYAIFLHDNGTVCLDAISDISKISNVAEFVGTIQELSKYDIDFSEVTPEDLIIEGDEMIEDLEKELDKEDLTEEDIEQNEEKANTALTKIGILATMGGAIGAAATGIFSKLKNKLSFLKSQKGNVPKNEAEAQEEKEMEQSIQKSHQLPKTSFEDVCPRVNVDEEKVISSMQEATKLKEEQQNRKKTDTYGDGDPDGDDISL
ncbi:MAG: hypothetical protein J6K42_08485 [Clostridia bacterium]|nr:hypothetical protein [Clostridia bacterium]